MDKQTAVAGAPAEFAHHPHWQLLERIVASPQFVRSARLNAFLVYVTRCVLLDHAEEVTEPQVGMHVFGRPAGYNASEDNIVRSQARFLRIKLAEYFDSAEGRKEPLVLTIPKGMYLPHFAVRVELPAGAPEAPPHGAIELPPQRPIDPPPHHFEPPLHHKVQRWRWWRWMVALGVFACLLVAAVVVRQRFPQTVPVRAPEASLWPRLFDARQMTTIVASDYIFSMVQEAAGRTLSLDEYLAADYFSRIAQLNAVSGLEHLFPNIAQRHYTGFENVTSVARMMGVKQAQSARMAVRFARDLTMREVDAGNLILLGSKQSNPWVLLFEDKLNFRFEYQSEGHAVYIVNRTPQPGEEAVYRPSALDASTRAIYGAIAFLPNLKRRSNVLILEGTSMGGEEMALEVLDNPVLFRDLVRRVTAGRRGGDLPYFEALISTRTLNGVPGESAIVAYRVLGE